MSAEKQAMTSVQRKILDVARELFYREGIRAVGVDTIVEKAGVAKTSLYRWFSTKDDLIAAFLEQENDDFWVHWDKVAARHEGMPRQELSAHLEWIAAYIRSPKYRGCPFLNATAEFPAAGHASRAVCRKNKEELQRRLEALGRSAGARDPELLADQLALLLDGAFANSQVLGKAGPVSKLVSAGETLIDAALLSRRK